MTLGKFATDREVRIDFQHMRDYRLARTKEMMEKHGIGCLLTFDAFDIRYTSSAYITPATRWPEFQFVVLPRNGEPYVFGGIHEGHAEDLDERYPWLKGRIRPMPFGSVGRSISNPDELATMVKIVGDIMAEHGVTKEPVGLDGCTTELVYAEAFKKAGITAVDGQRPMFEARLIKCKEELACMRHAAANAEAGFADIKDAIRPGISECEIVGVGQNRLYAMGADLAWEFVCCSGNRTNPLSIDYTDRQVRPGDLIIVDINGNAYMGYQTCYYRTFCCGKANAEQEEIYEITRAHLYELMGKVKAGKTIGDIYSEVPMGDKVFNGWNPKKYGWNSWEESSAVAFGHGIGISLHEDPFIMPGGANESFKFEENMTIALENWFGYKGGYHGVRLEEDMVVTKNGIEVLTKFPIDKLTECWT